MLTGELHEGRSFLVAFGRREDQHTEREDREQRRGRTKNKKKRETRRKKKTWPTATDRFHVPLFLLLSKILTSDVMNEMNSLTHSCTVSFASLATLALGGSAFFIMRAMLAMGRYLSCSLAPSSWADIGACFSLLRGWRERERDGQCSEGGRAANGERDERMERKRRSSRGLGERRERRLVKEFAEEEN